MRIVYQILNLSALNHINLTISFRCHYLFHKSIFFYRLLFKSMENREISCYQTVGDVLDFRSGIAICKGEVWLDRYDLEIRRN